MPDPVSLALARAERSNRSKDWTVEMNLSDVLRQVREQPDSFAAKANACIVILGAVDHETGSTDVQLHVAGTQNAWESMGLLYEALHMRAE